MNFLTINYLTDTQRILSGNDAKGKTDAALQKLIQVNTTLTQAISHKIEGPPGDEGMKGDKGNQGSQGMQGIKGDQGMAEANRSTQMMMGYLASAKQADNLHRDITIEHIVPWTSGR